MNGGEFVGFCFVSRSLLFLLFCIPADDLLDYVRTPCTTDYGDCGCDNCHGEFEDISTRMDEFADRLFTLGWDRTKAVWTVPQAFGGSSCVSLL